MSASRKRRVLVWIGAMLAALVAFVGVNAIDEELTPGSRALFTLPIRPFAPDSGWALIAGFHAPLGDDPRAFAAALWQQGKSRKPGQANASIPRPLQVRAPDELLCVPQSMDCVRAFAQRPDSIGDLVLDNRVVLARYAELLDATQLADVVAGLDFFEGNLPHFATILRAQQVALSQAGVSSAQGRPAEAISWLEKDASFHRRWLEESGSILTKMLAVRALSRDFLVAGQVARSGIPLPAAQWEALERIGAPLTVAQRGIAPVQRIEAALFARVLDLLVADSTTVSRIIEAPRLRSAIQAATLRRNATLNFAYPFFLDWTMFDTTASRDLAGAIERVEAQARSRLSPDWTWAYNYTGRRFVAESKPDVAEYVYRLRDLDALAATIRCVIAIRRQGVGPDGAAAFVAASPACTDPYEGRALSWDAQQREVSFRARSPGQVKRFGGRGDRVTFSAFPAS